MQRAPGRGLRRARCRQETITTITDRVMDGMAEWEARPLDAGLRGGVHRRDPGEDPRRARSPTVRSTWPSASPWTGSVTCWAVGRGARRRRRSQAILAAGPRRRSSNRRCGDVCMLVCDGLKRPARRGERGVEKTIVRTCSVQLLRIGGHPDLRRAPAAQQLRVRQPARLGRHRRGPQAGLHRRHRGEALERFAEFAGEWEKTLPGDYPAVGERLGRSSSRSSQFDREIRTVIMHDERDRVDQRPAPPRGARPAATSPPSRPRSRASTSAIMSLDPTGADGSGGATGGRPP